jgi:DNA primase catalytic core, N-terminal domain
LVVGFSSFSASFADVLEGHAVADLTLDPDSDDQTLLNQIVDFYHQTLKGNTAALDFLRGKGVSNTSAIDHFRLGYCDRTLGRHVPAKSDSRGRRIRERLEGLGLIHGKGHEYFINFVVCPITVADGSGRIVNLYGRRIVDDPHSHRPDHKHLHASRPGVWNVEAFVTNGDLILCSSLFDALVFWNNGYRNVTCTFMANAIPIDHLTAIQNCHIQRVLTPCPGLPVKLLDAGLDCHFLRLPNNQDACAFALQAGAVAPFPGVTRPF